MTEYTPKVGDRVRYTHLGGSIIEGVINTCTVSKGIDSVGLILWDANYPGRTELLHRPVEFKTAIGTCYTALEGSRQMVVRVLSDDPVPWLGRVGGEPDTHWFTDDGVQRLVEENGWVEHTLTEREGQWLPD